MRKIIFKKVQSSRFYRNVWIIPGTFCKNEERRVIIKT